MRQKIEELVKLGPLPSEEHANAEDLERFERMLKDIKQDAAQSSWTNDEVKALVSLFGPGECFGGAWTLLHLIESAPGWPIEDCLVDTSNKWVRRLNRRSKNVLRS